MPYAYSSIEPAKKPGGCSRFRSAALTLFRVLTLYTYTNMFRGLFQVKELAVSSVVYKIKKDNP